MVCCDLATGEDTDCGDRAGDADGGHVADGLEVDRLSFCRDREAGDNCQSNYRSGLRVWDLRDGA